MSEVIVVLDFEITVTVKSAYIDIVVTCAKKASYDLYQQILKLIESGFTFKKLGYQNINNPRLRYFDNPTEIQFLTEYYDLQNTNNYCSLTDSYDYHLLVELEFYLLKQELIEQQRHLSTELTNSQYKQYRLYIINLGNYGYMDADIYKIQEYFQKIYQILYLQKLDLGDSKKYDYGDIINIIGEYILDNGVIVKDTIFKYYIFYPDWRPLSKVIEKNQGFYGESDLLDLSEYYQKWSVEKLYYIVREKFIR